ncbi:MAG: FtsX-like permease family protein, partial [Acidobacteriota bacterium]
SRGRLLRQWMTEGLLLAGVGAVCGWGVALYTRAGLLALLPETYGYLQLVDRVRSDWRVVSFTLGVTVLTAVVFSIVPAMHASRMSATEVLKDGQRGTEGAHTQRVRNVLVVAEVALAFVLLVGAGLLVKSFLFLQRTQLGFDPHNVFGISLNLPMNTSQAEKTQLISQFQALVAGLPEVEAAAVTTQGVFPYLTFQVNRVDKPLAADEPALYEAISPNYFTALGGALIKGRYFNEQDADKADPVALINETLARKYFAGEDALDKAVTLNYLGKPQRRRVIGVVRDMSQGDLTRLQPQLFVPFAQQPWFGAGLVARSRIAPFTAWRAARQALIAIDSKQASNKFRTADELIGERLQEPRLYTVLLGICGLLALVLAVAGIFGVMSYNVTQRRPEIGIRMALGAQRNDVLKMMLSRGMTLVMAGIALGVAGSLALTRLLSGLLFGVGATDPLTFLLISALLTMVALCACYIPARNATRVDPLVALRLE